MDSDVIVVGAGVAGLACARQLGRAGKRVVLLEKSRGVGGRCATRRVEGMPVDFGLSFYHGHDSEFVAALQAVPATRIEGWPRRVHGSGRPCQRAAFGPTETRVAYREGVNAFPKHLAADLDVRRQSRVISIGIEGDSIVLTTEDGATHRARDVVSALPGPQTGELLQPLAGECEEMAAILRLLDTTGSLRCLTLLAGYPSDVAGPEWDVCYPEDSRTFQMVSHDSAKREGDGPVVLVMQGQPAWSNARWDDPGESWTGAMLEEASRLVGPWAGSPAWTQCHRWRYARADRSDELAGPVLVGLPGGARVGLAGEIFSPGSGVQAAWRSGGIMAARLLGESA